ncbi:hypothetical protein E2C01_027292 [Portunus trituberculatus]|uniref:Uncharacterized protein n=1 Tax=Portunus trituberculatus TaxID=210409 RepID=A0A5B7ELJ2_PORTR|nr:hypothetical protein [Portunus trituberculatus]
MTTAFNNALERFVAAMGEDMTLKPRHRAGGLLIHLAPDPQAPEALGLKLTFNMHSLRERKRPPLMAIIICDIITPSTPRQAVEIHPSGKWAFETARGSLHLHLPRSPTCTACVCVCCCRAGLLHTSVEEEY